MVDYTANSTQAKLMEFYYPNIKVFIQALLPRHYYIDKIDLKNIIINNRTYCIPWKNDNNFIQGDYNLSIEIVDVVYVDEYTRPKHIE